MAWWIKHLPHYCEVKTQVKAGQMWHLPDVVPELRRQRKGLPGASWLAILARTDEL